MSFAEISGIRKRPWVSCGVVYVILRLAFSVQHRLATDRQTDRRYTALAWRRVVNTVRSHKYTSAYHEIIRRWCMHDDEVYMTSQLSIPVSNSHFWLL